MIIGIIAVLIVMALFIYFKSPLPRLEEVTSIQAKYYIRNQESVRAEFDVSKEFWSELYAAMLPSIPEIFNSTKWVIMGELVIKTNDGSQVKVTLFSVVNGVGAFSTNTPPFFTYHRGGNTKDLQQVLDKALKSSKR